MRNDELEAGLPPWSVQPQASDCGTMRSSAPWAARYGPPEVRSNAVHELEASDGPSTGDQFPGPGLGLEPRSQASQQHEERGEARESLQKEVKEPAMPLRGPGRYGLDAPVQEDCSMTAQRGGNGHDNEIMLKSRPSEESRHADKDHELRDRESEHFKCGKGADRMLLDEIEQQTVELKDQSLAQNLHLLGRAGARLQAGRPVHGMVPDLRGGSQSWKDVEFGQADEIEGTWSAGTSVLSWDGQRPTLEAGNSCKASARCQQIPSHDSYWIGESDEAPDDDNGSDCSCLTGDSKLDHMFEDWQFDLLSYLPREKAVYLIELLQREDQSRAYLKEQAFAAEWQIQSLRCEVNRLRYENDKLRKRMEFNTASSVEAARGSSRGSPVGTDKPHGQASSMSLFQLNDGRISLAPGPAASTCGHGIRISRQDHIQEKYGNPVSRQTASYSSSFWESARLPSTDQWGRGSASWDGWWWSRNWGTQWQGWNDAEGYVSRWSAWDGPTS